VNPEREAIARAALDLYHTNGDGSDWRADGVVWDEDEVAAMDAALRSPTVDGALQAVGAAPGSWMSEPGQDELNKTVMAAVLERYGSANTATCPSWRSMPPRTWTAVRPWRSLPTTAARWSTCAANWPACPTWL
jgi:hypothetical protein